MANEYCHGGDPVNAPTCRCSECVRKRGAEAVAECNHGPEHWYELENGSIRCHCGLGIRLARVHAVLMQEREACAAYCLDRADQYQTTSPVWVALADCAEAITKGEAATALRVGETEDLLNRVRRMAVLGNR